VRFNGVPATALTHVSAGELKATVPARPRPGRSRSPTRPGPFGTVQGYLQLDDSFPPGSGFYIYKMEPGAVSTPHEHTCRENFLILEGELIDNDGYVYRAGDLVMLDAATQQSSTAPDGCLIAVFVRTIERELNEAAPAD
jgi:hypothetical protein